MLEHKQVISFTRHVLSKTRGVRERKRGRFVCRTWVPARIDQKAISSLENEYSCTWPNDEGDEKYCKCVVIQSIIDVLLTKYNYAYTRTLGGNVTILTAPCLLPNVCVTWTSAIASVCWWWWQVPVLVQHSASCVSQWPQTTGSSRSNDWRKGSTEPRTTTTPPDCSENVKSMVSLVFL